MAWGRRERKTVTGLKKQGEHNEVLEKLRKKQVKDWFWFLKCFYKALLHTSPCKSLCVQSYSNTQRALRASYTEQHRIPTAVLWRWLGFRFSPWTHCLHPGVPELTWMGSIPKRLPTGHGKQCLSPDFSAFSCLISVTHLFLTPDIHHTLYSSGSQSVAPGSATLASAGNSLECKFNGALT